MLVDEVLFRYQQWHPITLFKINDVAIFINGKQQIRDGFNNGLIALIALLKGGFTFEKLLVGFQTTPD